MSARRVWRNGQYVWIPEGPSGCRTEPKHFVGGALVVGGPVTGPVTGFFGLRQYTTDEEVREAKLRFHPHGRVVRAGEA